MSDNKPKNLPKSIEYFLNSFIVLGCALPPIKKTTDILWYIGLPIQVVLIILGKLIRLPAEIWSSPSEKYPACPEGKHTSSWFLTDAIIFIIESILYLQGGLSELFDIIITSLGFAGSTFLEKEDIIPVINEFGNEVKKLT